MFKKLMILAGLGCVLALAYLAFVPSGGPVRGSARDELGAIMPVPAATLKTSPLKRSETILIDQSSGWDWLNPFAVTGTKFELEANYRHRIEPKGTWNFVFDPDRAVAFVIMPDLRADDPVEFQIIKDKKIVGGFDVDSSWFWRPGGGFEEFKEHMKLLRKLNQELLTKASDPSMVASRMGEARLLVEAHVRNWLIAEGHCTVADKPVVKVFTMQEAGEFPVPEGRTIGDFKP